VDLQMGKNLYIRRWIIVAIIFIIVIGIIYFINLYKGKQLSPIPDKLINGDLTDAQKQTITLTTEFSRFIVTINTAIFAALGFYLTRYRDKIQKDWLAYLYLVSLLLLGVSIYFTFKAYALLTSDLAQNLINLIPKRSRVFHFLEISCWSSFISCFILLIIFTIVLLGRTKENFH
jgi:hypothetical protein